MAAIVKDAVKYFTLDKVDIDNWAFKLFSKVSVGLFILASVTSIASSYWGKPIECHGLNNKAYELAYCWIHGSYHLTNRELELQVNNGQRCFRLDKSKTVDQVEEDMAPDTAFYLWVSIMLFVHGLLFMVPDQIWKFSEGGVMEQFKAIREKSIADVPEHAKQFKAMTKNQNNRYFITLMVCEVFNILIGVINFILIDTFLAGNFLAYGKDVIQYYRGNIAKQTITFNGGATKDVLINPMCSAFPTMVNCIIETGGVNQNVDKKSYICLLAQNIINEKIYLALWFWFIVLFFTSGIILLYRGLIITQPWFRRMELQSRIRTTIKLTALQQIEARYNGLGDWFLLCQIGRNSTPYYFRAFLRELARDKNESGENKEQTDPLIEINGDDGHNRSRTDALNMMEHGGVEALEMKPKFV